jgi:predicted glycoside hydrolase/deacetylase ChbG (UPF0249 family)
VTSLVVAADDYGLSPGVDAAIRDLIATGSVTATSCMTVFPEWPDAARALAPLADRADVGLHLTLTDHAPLGPMPVLAPDGRLPTFGALLKAAHRRTLDPDELRAELHRQLDAFEAAWGRPPDHVDGHHHVQQLPVVRDVVVEVVADRLGGRAWTRTCAERPSTLAARPWALRAVGFALAARSLDRRLRALGLPTNQGFCGVHDYTTDPPHAVRLEGFLRGVRPGTVLMVHPGFPDDVLRARDSLVDPRAHEHAALRDVLPELLARRGLRAVRFGEVRAPAPSPGTPTPASPRS